MNVHHLQEIEDVMGIDKLLQEHVFSADHRRIHNTAGEITIDLRPYEDFIDFRNRYNKLMHIS